MLRRRSRTPKVRGHETPKPHGAPRRRERPEVPVPASLKAGHRVVLVTGFDPFGGERINPSWEVATRLPREIAGLRVETARVPCEFRRSIEVLAQAIERHQPELVILLGQ